MNINAMDVTRYIISNRSKQDEHEPSSNNAYWKQNLHTIMYRNGS